MDKNKLLRIITKDLDELTEITQELAQKKQFTHAEIELALSKSRIVLQEFEFLKEMNGQPAGPTNTHIQQVPVLHTATDEPLEEIKNIQPEKETAKIPAQSTPPAFTAVSEQQKAEATEEDSPNPACMEKEERPAEEVKDTDNAQPEPETTENKEEENQAKIVGEFFTQGKSLNELLSGTGKLDQKLASSPISKLETAIGLNDRFQYIRELFNNDSKLFQHTVTTIDQMSNINEAVSYLDTHFKWQKNDMSIQFAHLVKRRFSN